MAFIRELRVGACLDCGRDAYQILAEQIAKNGGKLIAESKKDPDSP